MAMRVVVAGSGSRGNATLFEDQGTRVLVDAGLSIRELNRRLAELPDVASLSEFPLDGLILTHSHGDHIKHVESYAKRLGVPVHATRATLSALEPIDGALALRPKGKLQIASIPIETLSLSHDVPQIAVIVGEGEERTALVTDLGRTSASLERALQHCPTVLLESNHCEELLQLAPYPAFLKRRIASNTGHLSNRQCADILLRLSEVRRVVLMHLSQKANSPRRARRIAETALAAREIELLIADQDRPLLLPSRIMRASQLAFGF